ncbi:potassium channel family protein [Thiolapillus sp.]
MSNEADNKVDKFARAKRILIVGAGAVGLEVARQLTERGERVHIVDDQESAVEKARAQGFYVERINLQDDGELKRVGIGGEADVLFALLDEDASNVFLVISARALAPELPIVSISGVHDTIERLHAAGATKVIDPYRISGYKIYERMHRPLIAETLEHTVFGKVNLDIAEIHVREGCFLHGKYLDELSLEERYDLIVLGVVDREFGDHLIFATDPKRHRMDSGDVLVVIGPEEAFRKFHADLNVDEK